MVFNRDMDANSTEIQRLETLVERLRNVRRSQTGSRAGHTQRKLEAAVAELNAARQGEGA